MDKLKELKNEVNFRDTQLNLLYDLLMRNKAFLYPIIHLYGLSGTGKTFTTRRFMDKFCNNNSNNNIVNKYYVYVNCNEVCYSTMSLLFNEILVQIRNAISDTKLKDELNNSNEFELDTDVVTFRDDKSTEIDDEDSAKLVDCSCFIKQLRKYFDRLVTKTCFYFVFDNADSLKYFGEASNLLLTLCKINEYLHAHDYDQSDNKVSVCSLFITEMDWHSFLSDCDVMSRTDAPRPFVVAFSDYTKDQMYVILKKTACSLVTVQDTFNNRFNIEMSSQQEAKKSQNIEFYARIILDVFYPICKDLNEIQYLIQIYYDQLLSSAESATSQESLLSVWNKMKPFLKQALTQIYLRQSMFTSTSSMSNKMMGSTGMGIMQCK